MESNREVNETGRRLALASGEATAGEGKRTCIIPTKALKLEYDDVPERIVEVAAPADAKGDPMGLIDRR